MIFFQQQADPSESHSATSGLDRRKTKRGGQGRSAQDPDGGGE